MTDRMPSRGRGQQLEEESRAALRMALPEPWVFRDLSGSDVGVDGDIEVFTESGEATGLKAAVQLKATDANTVEDSLSIRLKISTINYLRSLDAPSMIVTYHAPSGRIFGRWMSAFRESPTEGQQTLTLHLEESDELVPDRFERIERELRDLRRWQAGDPDLPLAFDLVHRSGAARTHQIAAVVNEWMAERSVPAEARASTGDGCCAFTVEATESSLEVSLLHIASFSWTFSHRALADAMVPPTISLMMALLLARTGKTAFASRFLVDDTARSPLMGDPGVALTVGGVIGAGSGVDQALSMAGTVLHIDGYGFDAGRGVVAGFVSSVPRMQLHDRRVGVPLVEFSESALEHAADIGRNPATVHFSLGALLFDLARYREAFHNFRAAAVNDGSYRMRSYWMGQTAACLFELGRFRLAADLYEAAQSAPDREVDYRGGWADALIHAGRYSEGIRILLDFLAETPDADPWWHLKAAVLADLLDGASIRDGQRHPVEATALCVFDEHVPAEKVQERCFDALDLDPLCHEAWRGLALASFQLDDPDGGRRALALASAFGPSCLQCPTDLFLASVGSAEYTAVAFLALESAYYAAGSEVIELLREKASEAGGILSDELAEAINVLANDLRTVRERPNLGIRLIPPTE